MADLPTDIKKLFLLAKSRSASFEFEYSIQAWKRLIEMEPENWGHVLDLVHDLRKCGHDAEADEIHHRAAIRFPNEFWIIYHWALAAWNKRDFAAAEQRSNQMSALISKVTAQQRREFGHHAYWLLGSLAMSGQRFREASDYFELACDLAPTDPLLRDLLIRAKHYDRFAASFGRAPLPTVALHAAADYKVLVINLDRDEERFRRLCDRFNNSPVQLNRVPGVYGSYLPRSARQALCSSLAAPAAGSIGCLLSHVKAWEMVLARKFDVCLILEDDAMPMINLPHRFASIGIPPDFDLCFVNRKMEPEIESTAAEALTTPAIFEAAQCLATFHTNYNSPGTDGYFISEAGARKMLSNIEKNGFDGDVDWLLVGYSLPPGAKDRWPPHSEAFARLSRTENLCFAQLRAFALFPCLVDADTSYINTRVTENQRAQL